jgi:nitrogen-specific signal transduction histidine kinase
LVEIYTKKQLAILQNLIKEIDFFPFFTTKEETTGLGLPIVKKSVDGSSGTPEDPRQP